MKLIVTIIGFGNIGKVIAPLLLLKKDYRFHINIIDTDISVSGAILDLEHALQLYKQHQLSYNNAALLNESDYIFHCAGASVPKGMSRLVTCQASVEITEAVFKNFKPIKKPFIIVVANPVEIITFITQKITGLPKEKVIGTGTLVDSIRMNYAVKNKNKDIASIDSILLGEHGSTAFLSEQLSTVNNLPFSSLFDRETINELMEKVKSSAEEIKETQKATIYGVSFCAWQIFEALLSEKAIKLPISTFIPEYLNKILGNPKVCLSLLSEISTKGAFPIENYHPNKNETKLLKDSVNLIKACIPEKYS